MLKENTVAKFLNDNFGEVRAVTKGEDIWFVAKDICDILGTKTKDIPSILKGKGVDSIDIPTNGGKQKMTIISEQSLYKLIFKSRKPFAEEFQDWICGEVIPSIRKNDGYVSQQEELTPEEIVANALIVAQNIIKEKEKRIQEQQEEISNLTTVNEVIITHSTTIEDSRTVINSIIKKIGGKNNNFGEVYNEFYRILNYKLGINIKARDKIKGKSWLDTLNDEETFKAEEIARNWAIKNGLDINSILTLK